MRRQGPPVGRRARSTWTATLDYMQKTRHLGAMLLATQDGRNEYARDMRPRLLVPHFADCYASPRRSRPKLHHLDCFAPRDASMLQCFQPRPPHLTTQLAISQRKPRYCLCPFLVPPTSLDLGLPSSLELCIRPFILESSCLLYTSPSPRDRQKSRMPSSA